MQEVQRTVATKLSVQDAFNVVRATVPGGEHPYGSQDSMGLRKSEKYLIGVVADGCSAGFDSGNGARMIVQFALNASEDALKKGIPLGEEFALHVEGGILNNIRMVADLLLRADEGEAKDITPILYQSFLATIVLLVVTPETTMIAGCGDGVYMVDGRPAVVLRPKEDNKPEYLAYALCRERPVEFPNPQLRVIELGRTDGMTSVLIGTDGVLPFVNTPDLNIANSEERIGRLSQFVTDTEYVNSELKALEKLQRVGARQPQIVGTKSNNGQFVVSAFQGSSILADDATFLAVIKKPVTKLPYYNPVRPLASVPVRSEPRALQDAPEVVRTGAVPSPITGKGSPANLPLKPAPKANGPDNYFLGTPASKSRLRLWVEDKYPWLARILFGTPVPAKPKPKTPVAPVVSDGSDEKKQKEETK
jgi:hypothetical protein